MRSWREFLALSLIVGITIGIFADVLQYEFINYDDPYLVQNNGSLLRPLSERTLLAPVAGLYHPLTNFSYWVDAQLAGLSAQQFHLTNLLFHLLAVCGAFLFVLSCSDSLLTSCLLTAAFAWHPAHVESVAWIAERKDVVSGAFFWWALYAFVKDLKKTSLLLMGLSLLAKPGGLVFPLVVALIVWRRTRSRNEFKAWFLENWRFALAMAVMSVAAGASAVIAQSQVRSPELLSVSERLIRLPAQLLFYVEKSLWPTRLHLLYVQAELMSNIWVTSAALIFLAATWLWARRSKKFREDTFFGFGFFIVLLLPVLKLVPFGDNTPVSERYLYLAQTGLFWPWARLVGSLGFSTNLWLPILTFTFAAWAHLSWERVGDWENSITLWESELRVNPGSRQAHDYLGRHYIALEQPEKALKHLRLGQTDDFVNAQNQAFAWMRLRRLDKAEKFLALAEQKAPADPQILTLRGNWFLDRGDFLSAEANFKKSLEVSPKLLTELVRAEALTNLGVVAYRRERFEECVQWQDQALESAPAYAYAYQNRGLCFFKLGRDAEAERDYKMTVRLAPQIAMAHNGLGVLAMKRGDFLAAEKHLLDALKADPKLDFAKSNLDAIRRRLNSN